MDDIGTIAAQVSGLVPEVADSPWLRGMILLSARLVPVTVWSPLVGGSLTPLRWRIGAGVGLASLLALLVAPAGVASTVPLVVLLLKELLIGAVLALAILCMFEVYRIAGRLIDQFRGEHSAGGTDAFDGRTQMGMLLMLAALAIFWAADGHVVLLGAIADSLGVLPMHAMLPAAKAGMGAGSAGAMGIGALSMLVLAGVKLALPVIVVLLGIDLALGIAGRLSGGMDALQLGPGIKTIAGIGITALVLAAGLSSPMREFLGVIGSWVRGIGV
ncbi:MAG: flagellar biosynthetic protein FliR [Phycisphaerales bacterium]|nr:flagellar biosynthetic protein FliR [Phycisphaerales bacterium]